MSSPRRSGEADPCSPARRFTRDDERCLQSFKGRLQAGESLTAAENTEMEQLLATYMWFLDEGERRLREGSESPKNRKGESSPSATELTPPPSSPAGATSLFTMPNFSAKAQAVSSAMGTASRAAYFWGSLVATAVPGMIGKSTGLTPTFRHWNWVTDRLVLGALPVVTQIGSSGNHLAQLRSQLEERQQRLGIVVACLSKEEMDGFGVGVVEFAQAEHWHDQISPAVEYLYLPMPDGTADIPIDEVVAAVDAMHRVLDVEKRAAYVHCKAGKGRSWMVCMCYLITYGGRSFENAEALIRMARYQVNPSSSQRDFPRDFKKKFEADLLARRLMNEQAVVS